MSWYNWYGEKNETMIKDDWASSDTKIELPPPPEAVNKVKQGIALSSQLPKPPPIDIDVQAVGVSEKIWPVYYTLGIVSAIVTVAIYLGTRSKKK
jgi:hypothetical protein